MKTTFVRRTQFEDALQESFKTWGVKLPSRGGAAMWDGWQPIGFNGPIPLFHDPAQQKRELSEAARDVTIQQRAQETGTSSTQVRMEQDMADGRPAPGAPAAGQNGFQHPPVGGGAGKPRRSRGRGNIALGAMWRAFVCTSCRCACPAEHDASRGSRRSVRAVELAPMST